MEETPQEAIVRLEARLALLNELPGINGNIINIIKTDLAFYRNHSQK